MSDTTRAAIACKDCGVHFHHTHNQCLEIQAAYERGNIELRGAGLDESKGATGAEMSESFKVPLGGTVKCFRHKVKRPRVTGFHIEGRWLMAELSCGHSVQYCRVPKWTRCYTCTVETIHFERPRDGYREIQITNTRPQ